MGGWSAIKNHLGLILAIDTLDEGDSCVRLVPLSLPYCRRKIAGRFNVLVLFYPCVRVACVRAFVGHPREEHAAIVGKK